MNRRLSLLGLTVSVAGCASASPPGASEPSHQPATEATITLEATPSALTRLDVTEHVEVEPPSAKRLVQRAIADASRQLAVCFRASVARDPELAGSITFGLRLGGSGNTERVFKQGELASLPSAECARKVLEMVSIPAPTGEIHAFYTVTFGGRYRPDPLPKVGHRFSTWSVDWDAADGEAPPRFDHPLHEASEAFRRCAIGVEPWQSGPSWVVMNVGTDGSVVLDDAGSKNDEADLCIRRKLANLRFSKPARPIGVAALFPPPKSPGPDREPAVPEESADDRGNMWGDEIGEAFGAGGLGLGGLSPGGVGRGEGIGLGSIGTLGHGAGTGTGQGFGSGRGRLGGSHSTKPPQVKLGSATAGPKYPPEVIQRIVRQSFGQYRLCYEKGLSKKPDLEGRVEMTFVIGRDGSVTSASGTGTMPDKSVISCVVSAFSKLRFPVPDGGVIKVTYPLVFSPGGDSGNANPPEKPAAPAIPKIDGRPLHEVGTSQIASRLEKLGYRARVLPAAEGAAAPPVVFYERGVGEVGHVRLTKTGSKPVGDCRRSEGGVSLTVRRHDGDCASLTSRLFD